MLLKSGITLSTGSPWAPMEEVGLAGHSMTKAVATGFGRKLIVKGPVRIMPIHSVTMTPLVFRLHSDTSHANPICDHDSADVQVAL